MKKLSNAKITALYERLSKDNDQKNKSVSIAHRKQMLEDNVRKNKRTEQQRAWRERQKTEKQSA